MEIASFGCIARFFAIDAKRPRSGAVTGVPAIPGDRRGAEPVMKFLSFGGILQITACASKNAGL
jgi:hypothetical protein